MPLSNEDFVQALYRGLLGRDADRAGLAGHASAFSRPAPAVDIATDLARSFIASDEFRGGGGQFDILASGAKRDGPPIVHIAALGSHCFASLMLKRLGLKRYSLPFDWIFSSLSMVEHCIADDCATLLDRAHYRVTPPKARVAPEVDVCGHAFYAAQFGIGSLFNHYDPTAADQYAYLRRCVDRLRRLLANPAPKLFVAVIPDADAQAVLPRFQHLAAALDRASRHAELLVLCIGAPSGPGGGFASTECAVALPHRLVQITPCSALAGLAFTDPFDGLLVARSLSRYRFALASGI